MCLETCAENSKAYVYFKILYFVPFDFIQVGCGPEPFSSRRPLHRQAPIHVHRKRSVIQDVLEKSMFASLSSSKLRTDLLFTPCFIYLSEPSLSTPRMTDGSSSVSTAGVFSP